LHRRQRKLLAPQFQRKRVVAFADAMVAHGERAQARWQDGEVINAARELTHLTLGIAAETMFGAAPSSGEADDIGDAFTIVNRYVGAEVGRIVHVPYAWPTLRNRAVHRAVAQLDHVIYRMIAERRSSGQDRGDLLSMLLAARDEEDGTGMTDEQVRDEAMTLLVAGYETTATALTWTLYLLTQHPRVHLRLCEELDRVLGGRSPTAADLGALRYTAQVFKESMRVYPPAYVVSRETVRPVDLGPHRLAAGESVLVNIYGLHRRPDYFPDPDRFDPDRFTPEREAQIGRYAYLPFGAGARTCIGNHFAQMQGVLLLATLAQRATFELVAGQRIQTEPLITLRARNGILMRIRQRDPGRVTPRPAAAARPAQVPALG
jgi:cytochrome P450